MLSSGFVSEICRAHSSSLTIFPVQMRRLCITKFIGLARRKLFFSLIYSPFLFGTLPHRGRLILLFKPHLSSLQSMVKYATFQWKQSVLKKDLTLEESPLRRGFPGHG